MSESGKPECTSVISVESQLFSAVEQNDRCLLRELLLSSHCDPKSVRNEKKETLLHIASKLGLLDIVRTLVEIYQLCPLEVDQFFYSSCHLACQFEHLHIMAYFFRIGGYSCIREFQPFHLAVPALLPDDFLLHMLQTAASSQSILMTRFVYTRLYFKLSESTKINLFYGSFNMLSKIVQPKLSFQHTYNNLHFAASCCENNLDMVKFFLDELVKVSPTCSSQEIIRSIYTSFLERACRLGKPDIVDYLTKKKGVSPSQQPSLEPIPIQTLQPYTHYDCLKWSYSPLHAAVQSGNAAILRNTIARSECFYHEVTSYFTTDHGTILHSACVSGKLELVRIVIHEFQCDINTQNNQGNTPLHVACEWGWFEIVQFLVEQCRCDVDVFNTCGHNPLTLAIKHSRIEIFNFLFSNHHVRINVKTVDTSETPLHLACCCDHSGFALALLHDQRYTCSLDAVDKFGDTPLFNACRLGNIEVVRQLVAKPECTRLMVNLITKETPAHIACRKNRLDILKILLTEGVSEPLKDVHLNYLGESLLHIACYNDAQEIIDFLIKNEISKAISNDSISFLRSPLHIACLCGNVVTVKKLLKSGICKTNDTDKNENTILHYICKRQQINPEMLEILSEDMDSNQMVEKKNTSGYNSLHLIFENDGIQILCCLTKYLSLERMNSALHSVDDSNDTPLHVAFRQERSLSLRYILNSSELAQGVSKAICMQNTMKDSPLHISCKPEYIHLLLSSPHLSSESIGRAVAVKDGKGRNIFHIMFINLRRNLTAITAVFKTFLEQLQEADIVSVLCMTDNEMNLTPLQVLIMITRPFSMTIYEELVTNMLSCLADSPLKTESIREICSVRKSNGETLVHIAVQRNFFETVKLLFTRELCEPEKTDKLGETSLHLACKLNQCDTAYFLCEHGCSAHKLDKSGRSPVVFLLQNNTIPLLQGLVSKGYCHPMETVQTVKFSDQSSSRQKYCYVMQPSDFKNWKTIDLPLLHSMVYNGSTYDILLPFIAEHENPFNLCDSFDNTLVHLKSFYHLFENNLVEFSDCDLYRQNKERNTPLHIACATGSGGMIHKLIESDKCGKSLTLQNKYGHTPLFYTSSRELINYLVMNGADPRDVADSKRVKHLTDMFKEVKDKHPLNLTVTALILGNSLAGKTTLIKSLRKAYNQDQLSQPSIGQVEQQNYERTAGIEISEFEVVIDKERSQRVLFCDFAGHPEFYSSHTVLLQNRLSFSESSQDSPLLFVIVLDITAPDKLKQLIYWAKFIQNCQLSCITGRKPEVIIIGSHVDKYSDSKDMHWEIKRTLSQAMDNMSDSVELVEYPILLNCCEPKVNELQKVKKLLIMSTEKLEKHADLDNRCHIIFSYLYDHFPDKPVKFSELQGNLRKRQQTGNIDFPFTRSKLIELLTSMHRMQHILLIGLTSESHDFWILTAMAQNSMFHKIQGLLFSGEDFDMRPTIESNVGVISSAEIKEIFPDIEYRMLQEFLVYSEFCKKIDDEEVLKLIEGDTSASTTQHGQDMTDDMPESITSNSSSDLNGASDQCGSVEYFFFPGLVKEIREKRNLNWKADDKYSYCSGWSLESAQGDFFSPLFLQILLLRLIFQFATTSMPDNVLYRRCIIWKNGVFWSAPGVEMLVEVTSQNQSVLVLVRCFQETELEAIKLRSAVVKEVFKVKAKHSSATKANEYVIYNPSLDDSGSLAKPVKMVAMEKIASAISKGIKYVQDNSFQHHFINKDLLSFEPYAGIDVTVMSSLFDPDKANESVPESILSSLYSKSDALPRHIDQFTQLISELKKPVLYQYLQDLFDEYSVFHGRDPKVSSML